MTFHFKDGYLYCEKLRVKEIQEQLSHSPFYLYSLAQLEANYRAYENALVGIDSIVGYAVKANNNLSILEHLRSLGSGAVLVSGNELRISLAAGFDPRRTVLNGNGKTLEELRLAVEHEVLINIDSEFDLAHIQRAAAELDRRADLLIRINPDVDPQVHPYVSTGIKNSKFGIRNEHLSWFLTRIRRDPRLNLAGVHCHLGSTIKKVRVFRDATELMAGFMQSIRDEGFDLRYLNIGGGLGIDYEHSGEEIPTPGDLIDSIRDLLSDGTVLIIEPGRSIVGDAAVFVNRVTGVKSNGNKRFIVTDGSMAELIRPSLYDAYQHIQFIEPVDGELEEYDVVGPVCESGDFLARDRRLPRLPAEGELLAVRTAGAYGFTMASNYNGRPRPAEVMVEHGAARIVRRRETLDDLIRGEELPT